MSAPSTRSFSFNHPWVLLLTLPLLFLGVMLVAGLRLEFNFMALFILIFNFVLLIPIVYLGFFRRLRFESDKIHWVTPRVHWTIARNEIRHYGIVKYRAFRFIYLSKAVEPPFESIDARITPDEQTFVIQFRKNAWKHVEAWLKQQGEGMQRRDLLRR